ncbi:metallophosphoesterase [Legionella fallonii]|uniref:Acid sphingomyelinase-like phosphodiesterase n=1 Tax=Legionella fallonii LLAP-10 TaxID=1212491 RepID=A0A098G5V7_9GAMM|nr:metallophosphoesterase [Legionella fallonii]CEG57888.1 Acid sphingomyelinase-like phosphodiesterase [Legionella fallonii LLAP-10]
MARIMQVLLLCLCFLQSAFATQEFLTISDIHYGSENKSQQGHDTGDEFLQITLNQLQQLSKNVNFILILGDLPTHSLFVTSKKEEFEKTVFHGLYEANQGKKPMFYITGNNDSLLGNYQPFESNGKSPLTLATDWTGACAYCEGLMIDDSHMHSEGYYSSYVVPGNKDVMLIALNSTQLIKPTIFSPKYPNQERDATAQFKWLEQQLQNSHAKQLLIAMHIPPGNSYAGNPFWQEQYTQNLINLLEQYHSSFEQITLLSSHTHMDELRKIHLKDGRNIYVYSTPSISRNHHNNPGMKIFTLDQQMAIKNYTTYYTTDLNGWGQEQYQALGPLEAIFPNCDTKNLAQCLDNLSVEQVCNFLEQDLFYGVKSARVPQNVCNKTYMIN